MQDLIINSQISTITTVRDVEITFTLEGHEFTAEFSVTITHDKDTGGTFSEPEILNQVALCERFDACGVCWTDEETKIVWEAAKKEGQVVYVPQDQFKKLEAEFGSAI